MKKILFYSTLKHDQFLLSRGLAKLASAGFYFQVIARSGFMIFGPQAHYRRPWLQTGALAVLWPLWYLIYFFVMLGRSLFNRADVLLCCQWPEQLILTPLASLFRWRVVWLRLPGIAEAPRGLVMRKLHAIAAKRAEIVVFSEEAKEKLLFAGTCKQAHVLHPALMETDRSLQQDMFQSLVGRREHRFVIGAIVENLDRSLMERLLSALTIALTVSPSFELVIVGEGEQRKPLQWLIRKMNLANHVWLAGVDIPPARWLEHVDVYAMPHEHPGLDQIGNALIAMNYGVPVLASDKAGISDIITSKMGALIDMADAETVARQFRRLEQDRDLLKELGKEAKRAAEGLSFERFIDELRAIVC